jgi:hypothetical protein
MSVSVFAAEQPLTVFDASARSSSVKSWQLWNPIDGRERSGNALTTDVVAAAIDLLNERPLHETYSN